MRRFIAWVGLGTALMALVVPSGLLFWSWINFGKAPSSVMFFYLSQAETAASQLRVPQLLGLVGILLSSAILVSLLVLAIHRLHLSGAPFGIISGSILASFSVAGLSLLAAIGASVDFTSQPNAKVVGGASDSPASQVLTARAELAPKGLNFIYIFYEGLAQDIEGADGQDIVSEIADMLEWTGIHFFPQEPGHTHTIAGMVASMCGIPFDNSNFGNQSHPSYLHQADACITDLTRAAGFRNYFFGGADLSFQNKGDFLEVHGVSALGRDDFVILGEQNMNSWGRGLNDSRLFARAKSQVRSLHAGADLFSVTLLTLDTHYPFYADPGCTVEGHANDSRVSYSCTNRSLRDFLVWLEQSGVLEDTIVVVQGDHLPKKLDLHGKDSLIPFFIKMPEGYFVENENLIRVFEIESILKLALFD